MIEDIIERARAFLFARRFAYRTVFAAEGPRTQEVLTDLAKFCRAHESTAHPDPTMRAQLDGRREVWLRIQNHLNLTDDQLWMLYGGGK